MLKGLWTGFIAWLTGSEIFELYILYIWSGQNTEIIFKPYIGLILIVSIGNINMLKVQSFLSTWKPTGFYFIMVWFR